MNQERLRYILCVLNRYELSLREEWFVEALKKYFNENGKITDQQESVLEGIYKEKTWIRKTFLGQSSSLKAAQMHPGRSQHR